MRSVGIFEVKTKLSELFRLGEPIEIKAPTAASLERYPGSNLIILGSKETESYGLLLSALLSLAVQRSPSAARFIVADFARPASPSSVYSVVPIVATGTFCPAATLGAPHTMGNNSSPPTFTVVLLR